MIKQITQNAKVQVRKDKLEGEDYLVVPMVMITEGVHNGSKGALYYPKDELAKTASVWNHKPVVVYHPEKNGKGMTACSPEVINQSKIGIILNTTFSEDDGKLRAEAWINIQKTKTVDPRILSAIKNNKMMEVSTGLFTDDESVDGTWNGEKYTTIARNYRPDHLAILPDMKGACSIEDGAGLLRNAESLDGKNYDDIRRSLNDAVVIKYGNNCWIETVFEKALVYHEAKEQKLYKVNYEFKDGEVVFSNDVEVERVVNYVPKTKITSNWIKVNGTFIFQNTKG